METVKNYLFAKVEQKNLDETTTWHKSINDIESKFRIRTEKSLETALKKIDEMINIPKLSDDNRKEFMEKLSQTLSKKIEIKTKEKIFHKPISDHLNSTDEAESEKLILKIQTLQKKASPEILQKVLRDIIENQEIDANNIQGSIELLRKISNLAQKVYLEPNFIKSNDLTLAKLETEQEFIEHVKNILDPQSPTELAKESYNRIKELIAEVNSPSNKEALHLILEKLVVNSGNIDEMANNEILLKLISEDELNHNALRMYLTPDSTVLGNSNNYDNDQNYIRKSLRQIFKDYNFDDSIVSQKLSDIFIGRLQDLPKQESRTEYSGAVISNIDQYLYAIKDFESLGQSEIKHLEDITRNPEPKINSNQAMII